MVIIRSYAHQKMTKKCYPQKFRTKGQYGNIRHTENMRTAQKTYSFLLYRAPQSAGQRRTSCIYSHFFSARGNRVKIFPKIPRNFILSAVFLCSEKLLNKDTKRKEKSYACNKTRQFGTPDWHTITSAARTMCIVSRFHGIPECGAKSRHDECLCRVYTKAGQPRRNNAERE